LLKQYYKINNWDFPTGNLCPPIPGRADYIHYLADLLSENNQGKIPTGKRITCYDIGVGANCIYPIIGVVEYNWNFIGSDIDLKSISSAEEAEKGTARKVKNLSGKPAKKPKLNFGGISNELVFEGGEFKFIQQMIKESKKFSKNFYWFSTLVSKIANLKGIYKILDKVETSQVKTIEMGTGNKMSRIVAWTFLTQKEQKEWRATRWNI